jgi:carboxypeptidase Q
MRAMRKAMMFVVYVLLAAAVAAPAQTAPGGAGNAAARAAGVRDEALKRSPALENNLRQLTDEIGGRVPGTPAMDQAVDWATAAFGAAGGENVHTEKFQIPRSWNEVETRLSVDSPLQLILHAVSVGWSPSLPPLRHTHFIDVGEGSAEDFQRAGDLTRQIALLHSKVIRTWEDLFEEYDRVPPILQRAVAGRAALVAWIGARDRDLLYRHTDTQTGLLARIPQVILAREEGLRIARLLASGRQVYGSAAVLNNTGGPFSAGNVVAEIRGAENSDEFVVLGAHLDSWELGTGALDNGCNAAMVVDVLRAIKASGLRPRRTIRFILFSGEEQGLLGSEAYARQHASELDKALAAVIFDSGTGRVTGFTLSGRTDLASATRELLQPLAGLRATAVTQEADMGTDNFDFLLQGVPTLVASQEPANYMENYHAQSDTFDKVDLGNLRNQAGEAAAVVFGIADAAQRYGTRQSRAQIEQLLLDTHLDRTMKINGVWPDWEGGKRGRAQ